jgi:hypothetical protein
MTKQKAIITSVAGSILLTLLFYSIIEYIHINRNIPYGDLTRDPNAIHESPKYIGLLSQIGMIFWFSTAGVLLFSTIAMEKLFKTRSYFSFLGNACFLTLFLGIDDMFMLHDELAHRGIKEEYFYLFYGIWLMSTILYFKKTIIQTLYPLILVYSLLFGLSVIIDKLIVEAYLTEDLLKFAGIINWTFYWLTTCYLLMKEQQQNSNKAASIG